jgi:hypothetical protein
MMGVESNPEGTMDKTESQSMTTTQILKTSSKVIKLSYDHLKDDANVQQMLKLGMMSGSKQAIEQGITTTTELLLGGGKMTNPNIRLSNKEQDYVLSQLMQRNFDKRRGISVFNSKTVRTQINGNDSKKVIPPVGIYEHKYAARSAQKLEKTDNIQSSCPLKFV